MNRTFRKAISFLLATVMIISSFASLALAAEDTAHDYPLIRVSGFMSEDIYKDKNDPESELVFPLGSDSILDLVKSCVPGLVAFAATQDWDVLTDALIPVLQDFFADWTNNPDGTTKGNTGAYFEYPTAEEMKDADKIYFVYDWRGDPVEIAAELDAFVNYVCEETGSEQVSISCHSLGGIITLSYLTLYGNERVNGVMFDSTAIYGETYTGELLSGDLKITADSLDGYLQFAFDGNEYDELINDISQIFKAAGIWDFVCEFADVLVENLALKAYPQVIAPLFAGWPTVWAMVPDEYMESAMSFVFDTVYKDSEIDYSGLKARVIRYNEEIRKNKTQTLLQIDETSRVAVLSRYGYSSIPATSSWYNISDGVVDTKNTSFGATTAPYGETFSGAYLEGKDMAYISPDLTVDASTCLFPEKTWFIRTIKHSDKTEDLDNMIAAILFGEEEATVDTYEEYPRFMEHDYASGDITTDKSEESKPETLLDILKTFFLSLVEFIRSIVK